MVKARASVDRVMRTVGDWDGRADVYVPMRWGNEVDMSIIMNL